MPTLTDFQISTITLLDYLYFHDIVALQTFSDEKNSFYQQLTLSLRLIVDKRHYKDLRAQHYQHLLLVGIDLLASYDEPSKSMQVDNQQFTQALNDELCLNIAKAGFDLDEFEQDLNDVLEQYPLAQFSQEVLYKVVSQVMCYQFDNITVCVLSRLLDHGFLSLVKYVKRDQEYSQVFLDIVFFRAMLFLEYEAFKNNLLLIFQGDGKHLNINYLGGSSKAVALIAAREKAKKLSAVLYRHIYQIDLNKSNDLKKYLTNVEERLGHNALLTNHISNWMSLVGAWHVMLIATTNPDKTLYRETAKYRTWPTCCDIAKKEMENYGFRVSERTLYDAYNSTESLYKLICIAVNEVNKTNLYGALEPILTHFFFFDPMIAPSFKSALATVDASLKSKKSKI